MKKVYTLMVDELDLQGTPLWMVTEALAGMSEALEVTVELAEFQGKTVQRLSVGVEVGSKAGNAVSLRTLKHVIDSIVFEHVQRIEYLRLKSRLKENKASIKRFKADVSVESDA